MQMMQSTTLQEAQLKSNDALIPAAGSLDRRPAGHLLLGSPSPPPQQWLLCSEPSKVSRSQSPQDGVRAPRASLLTSLHCDPLGPFPQGPL